MGCCRSSLPFPTQVQPGKEVLFYSCNSLELNFILCTIEYPWRHWMKWVYISLDSIMHMALNSIMLILTTKLVNYICWCWVIPALSSIDFPISIFVLFCFVLVIYFQVSKLRWDLLKEMDVLFFHYRAGKGHLVFMHHYQRKGSTILRDHQLHY